MMLCGMIVLSASSIGGLEWYESSPSGIPESPISGLAVEGWALSIEYADDTETQTLYLNGVEQSSRVLIRRNGRLISSEEFDAQGNLLSKTEYAYDVDGNPRIIYSSGNTASVPHVISDITLTIDYENRRHLEGFEENWHITDMNLDGRRSTLKIIDSDEIVGETNWIRDSAGNLLEKLIIKGTEEHRIRYDSKTRMIEEEILNNDAPILLRNYVWEGDKLVRVEERGNGLVKIKNRVWLGSQIIEETSTINGVISAELVWKNPNEKIETLYEDGKPFVRVHWKNGRKYKEEFLGDQEVTRVRDGGL